MTDRKKPGLRATFEDTLWSVVHESALGPKQIAKVLKTTYWNLCKMVEPDEEDRNFPASDLFTLMVVTGDHRPLRWLAGALGYELVRIEANGHRTAKDLGVLAEVYGKSVQALSKAYEEKHIDQEGINIVRDLLREVCGHRREAEKLFAKQLEFNLDQNKGGNL